MAESDVANMRIVVIGADGQLGTDLRVALGGQVVGFDLPALDVQDEERVHDALKRHAPDVVINCAAHTNVDWCEDHAGEAYAVNALGALHVSRGAARVGAAVVYISTDYVFGRNAPEAGAYVESDGPEPPNIYGASKLAGEHLTLACNAQTLVVRTCGLCGHAGARGKGGNFIETMLRLASENRPIRVVNDQRISPTTTVACAAVLRALIAKGARGVYHVAAPDRCTWFEFAQAIFEHEKLRVDLRPISSAEFPTRALRPAVSALASTRLADAGVAPCPPWKEMLREYLRTRPAHRAMHSSTPAAGIKS